MVTFSFDIGLIFINELHFKHVCLTFAGSETEEMSVRDQRNDFETALSTAPDGKAQSSFKFRKLAKNRNEACINPPPDTRRR